jgi:hypothetical protein
MSEALQWVQSLEEKEPTYNLGEYCSALEMTNLANDEKVLSLDPWAEALMPAETGKASPQIHTSPVLQWSLPFVASRRMEYKLVQSIG